MPPFFDLPDGKSGENESESISTALPGSGTVATTAMAYGLGNPEIRAGFTVAPAVVYWPIVPLLRFETNRSEPDTAMLHGKPNPEIRAGFTAMPVAVYRPIVPLL